MPPRTALAQVLPTQLVPDEKEGKILRVRLIMKEGKKLFDPTYLFDQVCEEATRCCARGNYLMLGCDVVVALAGSWLGGRAGRGATLPPTSTSPQPAQTGLSPTPHLPRPLHQGSTVSWIPCGRKLTCTFPGETAWPCGARLGRAAPCCAAVCSQSTFESLTTRCLTRTNWRTAAPAA